MCNLSEGIERRGIERGIKKNSLEVALKMLMGGAPMSYVKSILTDLTDSELSAILKELAAEKKLSM